MKAASISYSSKTMTNIPKNIFIFVIVSLSVASLVYLAGQWHKRSVDPRTKATTTLDYQYLRIYSKCTQKGSSIRFYNLNTRESWPEPPITSNVKCSPENGHYNNFQKILEFMKDNPIKDMPHWLNRLFRNPGLVQKLLKMIEITKP